MLSIIFKGGPLMIPIILCSIFALAIIIERVYHLRRAKIDTDQFMKEIETKLGRNRIMEAIDLCDNTPGPVAHILKAGILQHDRSRVEIKECIEDAGLQEIPRLEKRLNLLSTIAHITPLLGLLGTVTGMVGCFQTIQKKSMSFAPVNPGDLAGGIWEALITTAAGLAVAIPTLVAYNYLVSVINDFILGMETTATELLNVLSRRSEEL